MRLTIVIVAAVLLAVAGIGYTQSPQLPLPVANTQIPRPLPVPIPVTIPSEVKPLPDGIVLEQPAAPQVLTVEQMLDTVVVLREQKAALEKQEKILIDQINKKVEMQSERMRQLGIVKMVEKNTAAYFNTYQVTWR